MGSQGAGKMGNFSFSLLDQLLLVHSGHPSGPVMTCLLKTLTTAFLSSGTPEYGPMWPFIYVSKPGTLPWPPCLPSPANSYTALLWCMLSRVQLFVTP